MTNGDFAYTWLMSPHFCANNCFPPLFNYTDLVDYKNYFSTPLLLKSSILPTSNKKDILKMKEYGENTFSFFIVY